MLGERRRNVFWISGHMADVYRRLVEEVLFNIFVRKMRRPAKVVRSAPLFSEQRPMTCLDARRDPVRRSQSPGFVVTRLATPETPKRKRIKETQSLGSVPTLVTIGKKSPLVPGWERKKPNFFEYELADCRIPTRKEVRRLMEQRAKCCVSSDDVASCEPSSLVPLEPTVKKQTSEETIKSKSLSKMEKLRLT